MLNSVKVCRSCEVSAPNPGIPYQASSPQLHIWLKFVAFGCTFYSFNIRGDWKICHAKPVATGHSRGLIFLNKKTVVLIHTEATRKAIFYMLLR